MGFRKSFRSHIYVKLASKNLNGYTYRQTKYSLIVQQKGIVTILLRLVVHVVTNLFDRTHSDKDS